MKDLQPGDYGVISTNGFVARAIQVATRSRQNHAVIYIGNNTIIEAKPGGVVFSPLGEYAEVIWNFDDNLTDTQRGAILDAAHSLIGTPYGYANIASLALLSFGIHQPCLERHADSAATMICSQLVAYCYDRAGIQLIPGKTDGQVTPGDLAERILESVGAN